MADITMCTDKKCKRKNSCYRYTATPSKYYQSYFAEQVREDDECEYFIAVRAKTRTVKQPKGTAD